VPVTGPSSYECTYEGLVPRYEEGTKGSEPENGGGHIEERKHMGWGAWVAVSCICVVGCCLSEYQRSRGVS